MEISAASRSADGDRTRSAILKAAEALFVEQGFAATSMATVAKHANITKSLIHHHFGSKRELWDAVKNVVMQDYVLAQQRMMAHRTLNIALIEESLVGYFRFLQHSPQVVRLWTWMQVEHDEHCAELSEALTRAGLQILREGQRSRVIRDDVEAENIIAMFFSLVRGWFAERPVMQSCGVLTDSDEVCDEKYLRSVIKVFLDGLRVSS
jgi:TetR/AcrR family transcriptional regulator